jgi:hypothetical protein
MKPRVIALVRTDPGRGVSVTWNLKFLRGSVAGLDSEGFCATIVFLPSGS